MSFFNQMLTSKVFWFLVPVIGVVLITYLCGSVYQSSDEFELRSILSGAADAENGIPYPYVIYMNVLYSTLISGLYRLIPSWYWYDLVMYGVLLCSLAQISWVILCLYGNKCIWSQLLRLVVIVGVGVIPFLCVQFTTTAGFAAIAGVLTAVAWLDKRSGHGVLMLVMAWTSLLTASLIRFSACCSICLLAALLLAPFSWSWLCRSKLRISLFLAGFFVLVGSSLVVDEIIVSQNSEWTEARDFNQARSSLFDINLREENQSQPWNEETLHIAERYFKDVNDYKFQMAFLPFVYPGRSSVEMLCRAGEQIRKHSVRKFNLQISKILMNYEGSRNDLLRFAGVLAVFLVLCSGLCNSWLFAATYLFMAAVAFYFRMLPTRVWYTYLFLLLFLACLRIQDCGQRNLSCILCKLTVPIMGVLAILQFSCLLKQKVFPVKQRYRELRAAHDALENNGKVYLLEDAVREHAARPFCPNLVHKKQFVSGGALSILVPVVESMNYFKMDRDSFSEQMCAPSGEFRLLFLPNAYDWNVRTIVKVIVSDMDSKGRPIALIPRRIARSVYELRFLSVNPEIERLRVQFASPSKFINTAENRIDFRDAKRLYSFLSGVERQVSIVKNGVLEEILTSPLLFTEGQVDEFFDTMRGKW